MAFTATTKILFAVILLFVGFASANSAVIEPYVLDNIPEAGFPRFENIMSLSLTRNGRNRFTLAADLAPGSFVFVMNPSDAYDVTRARYRLTASFDRSGIFLNGNFRISGAIRGLGISNQELLSATLTDFNWSDTSPNGSTLPEIAFATHMTGGWALQFGTDESVYFAGPNLGQLTSLFEAARLREIPIGTAQAITTVPLPSAIWLFAASYMLLCLFRGNSTRLGKLA